MTDRRLGPIGEAMVEQMTPHQRYESMPRPLKWVRPRIAAEDAEYLRDLLEGEQGDQERQLGELRAEGKDEDDAYVVECRAALASLARLIKEVSTGIIDFAYAKNTEG